MESWDLCDEQGRKTGETWERSRVREIPEGRYHIVCDVLIRHQDGEFLLMRRDPEKDVFPGCLEASAGGAALAGETPEQAARRELKEETGLEMVRVDRALPPACYSVGLTDQLIVPLFVTVRGNRPDAG